jgi:hypothetical protein
MTKKKLVGLLFGLCSIYIILSSHSNGQATGSNADNTGAPSSTQFCSNCHNNSTAFGTVTLNIEAFGQGTNTPITSYIGGTTYDMRVTVSNSAGSPVAYGFQLTALKTATNAPAGTYSNLAGNVKQKLITTGTFNGRTYVEHNGVQASNQFNFSWTAPETGSGSVKFFAAGNAVNDNNSSSGDKSGNTSLTITEYIPLSVTSTFSNPTCFGQNNGNIDLTIAGSALPITVQWNDGPNNEDRSDLFAGNYSVTVTDANGAVEQLSFELIQPQVLNVSVDITQPLFPGEEGSVSILPSGGTEPYTIQITEAESGTEVPMATFYSAGCYQVEVSDANACTDTYSFCINPIEELTAEANVQNVTCFGLSNGSIILDLSGATPPYLVQWSNEAQGNSIDSLPSGNYIALVTDSVGYSQTFEYEITQPSTLLIEAAADTILCHGDLVEVTVSGSGGTFPYTGTGIFTHGAGVQNFIITDDNQCQAQTNITLSEPDLLLVTASSDTIACVGDTAFVLVNALGGIPPYSGTGIFQILTPGTLVYEVTDSNGCFSTTTTEVFSEDGMMVQSDLSGTTCATSCDGSIILDIANAEGATTILWNDNSSDTNRTNLCSGIYSVSVVDESGCTINNTYAIESPDEIDVIFQFENILCYGDSVLLLADILNAVEPYEFIWNIENPFENILVGAGQYEITVNDSAGCIYTESITIQQPDSIVVGGAIQNVSCYEDNSGSIDISVQGGASNYLFLWSDASENEDLANVSAANYSVVVTDQNGCQAPAEFEITEPEPLVIVIDNFVSGGLGAGDIEITVSGGTLPYNYLWTDGQTEEDVTLPSSSFQSLTVTDSLGCAITSEVFEVFDNIPETSSIAIKLYPVPAIDYFFIESNEIIHQIKIKNSLGQIVFGSPDKSKKFNIDTSAWPNGIYTVEVISGDKSTTRKIMKA